jgi:hypothetical protein
MMLEGGGIPERRTPRSGGMILSEARICAAKRQWLHIYWKITLLRFDVILWKKSEASSPFDLDTIHTLVIRVWRIGLRVICASCACFGKHNSTPHLTTHRYPQLKLSGNRPAQLSPAFHQWVWTIRNCVWSPSTWHFVSTPKSSSVTEGRKDFPPGVWTFNPEPSWGPGVPGHWAITPGPGVLGFVLKFLQFDGWCYNHQTKFCFQSLWSLSEFLDSPITLCIYLYFHLIHCHEPCLWLFAIFGLESLLLSFVFRLLHSQKQTAFGSDVFFTTVFLLQLYARHAYALASAQSSLHPSFKF